MAHGCVDAVVVGAGHNGLVAAALPADSGWDVVVCEQRPEPGGAVRTVDLVPTRADGAAVGPFRNDVGSAFHPLGLASPALRGLGLADYGLRWTHAPTVLAAASVNDAVALYADPKRTAATLGDRCRGDAAAWLRLYDQWRRFREPLLNAFLGPFPPLRALGRLARTLGLPELLRLGRFLLLPADIMAGELFEGSAARLLLLGNAAHADMSIDAAPSGALGYLLTMPAQDGGFPAPEGGAGALTQALVARATTAGARPRTDTTVTGFALRDGWVRGVHLAEGDTIPVRRAVVADVSADALYSRLLPADAVPEPLRRDMRRYRLDNPIVKVDYALSRPIPWTYPELRGAGTVHLGADARDLAYWNADLASGTVPRQPFVLLGQMTTTDPSRSPAGTESVWAYTLLPRGVTDDRCAELLAERIDATIEDHAPGFTASLLARECRRPSDLATDNANLVDGSRVGGTMALHQQLFFRPTPGLGGPDTPVRGLFLGSASIHPGGGVHGACGAAAARAALRDAGLSARMRRRLRHALAGW